MRPWSGLWPARPLRRVWETRRFVRYRSANASRILEGGHIHVDTRSLRGLLAAMSTGRPGLRGGLGVALVGCLFPAPAGAQQEPPATPVRLVVDTLHGTPVEDAYRWLEDAESEEVQAWFRAQGAYARSVLDTLSGRGAILERMRTIADAAPPRISLPRHAGGRWFYTVRRILPAERGRPFRGLGPVNTTSAVVYSLSWKSHRRNSSGSSHVFRASAAT